MEGLCAGTTNDACSAVALAAAEGSAWVMRDRGMGKSGIRHGNDGQGRASCRIAAAKPHWRKGARLTDSGSGFESGRKARRCPIRGCIIVDNSVDNWFVFLSKTRPTKLPSELSTSFLQAFFLWFSLSSKMLMDYQQVFGCLNTATILTSQEKGKSQKS